MPYVPSKKTVPPAEDREVLKPYIEAVAQATAEKITNNFSLIFEYKKAMLSVAEILRDLLENGGITPLAPDPEVNLAKAIYDVSAKYGYYGCEGAYLGEFNFVWTCFIQRVPQIKVALREWENSDELRYWVYACTVECLIFASAQTVAWGIGVGGTFEDIKDEYKIKVNQPYEMAQVLKSGDCYDAPYYMRLVPVVEEKTGETIGYMYVGMKRSPKTLPIDVLNGHLVYRSNPE